MADRLTGRTFGDFRIDALIGRGAVGRVYAATQLSLRRRVALKILEEGLFTPDEYRVRFQREAELIARLEHPNIIPIYAYGQEENFIYYAMRFVEGRTLDVLMGEGLGPREGLRRLADVATALEYAHARSVIHRDLKPANIMVADGVGFLADFGLARPLESTTITGTAQLLGTPLYMSPEQARREKATAASDLYALGVIAYEVVCRRHPFETVGKVAREEFLKRVASGDFPPPTGVPAPAAALILDLMALDPAARPPKPRARLLEAAELFANEEPEAPSKPHQAEIPSTPVAPSEPQNAKVFGKYRLMEQLGHGGMGVVFKARQTDLNRDVALKVMNFGPDVDETAVHRFRREAQAVARLRHPNIVAVHEAGDVDGRPYFSMDLVDGQSLSTMLDKGPLPARRAMEIVRDVAAAIVHAHAEGIVHRDLKPANVLVDAGGRVFVADFGLAKTLDLDGTKLTQSGDIMGTPAYMAPEQARGSSGLVDPRTDVYGMGAVLYHMLTGVAPFSGPDMYRILGDVVETDPTPPRSRNAKVHVDAETVCLRAMEKDPARRYKGAADFKTDVERFLAGEPIEARPAGAWSKLLKRVKRQPAVAALILIVVVGLVAGGVIFAVQQSRHRRQSDARELTREAAMTFLAGEIERTEKMASRATEIDPDWGPGWFWQARVDLFRYGQARGVPAAWVTHGEIEFDPVSADTPGEAALRKRAFERLQRGSLEGWERAFARAVVAFYDGRYAQASEAFDALLAENVPDREVYAYRVRAAYYARDFDRALEAATKGVERWGTVEPFLSMKVNALLALGLKTTLVGKTPIDDFYAPALELAKGDPVLRARALTLAGDWLLETGGDAEAEYAKAVDAVKDLATSDAHAARGDALLGLALARVASGRVDPDAPIEFEDAIRAYGLAIDAAPRSAGLLFKRAEASGVRLEFMAVFGRSDDSLDAMLADYASALRLKADFLDVQLALVRWTLRKTSDVRGITLQQRLKNVEACVVDLERLVRDHPDDARARLMLAKMLITVGTTRRDMGQDPFAAYERAVEELSKAIERHPAYVEAFIARGLIKLHQKQLYAMQGDARRSAESAADALKDLQDAMKVDPRASEAISATAQHWADEAFDATQRRLDPAEPAARARESFNKTLEINPRNVEAMSRLGHLETVLFDDDGKISHLDDADAWFSKALQAHPRHLGSLEWSAYALARRFYFERPQRIERIDEAIARIQQALKLKANHPKYLYLLGEYLGARAATLAPDPAAADDFALALKALGAALSIDADNVIARNTQAHVLIERALRMESEETQAATLDQAIQVLDANLARRPDFHDSLLLLGKAAAALAQNRAEAGRLDRAAFEKAADALLAARKLAPLQPHEIIRLGVCLMQVERYEEALDAIKPLLPDDPEARRLEEMIRSRLPKDF